MNKNEKKELYQLIKYLRGHIWSNIQTGIREINRALDELERDFIRKRKKKSKKK